MSLGAQIDDLISNNRSIFHLGEAVHPKWIEETEKLLKCDLPDSFKHFLVKYGGGYLATEEIFGIIPLPLEDFEIGPDLRSQYKIDLQNGVDRSQIIPIVELDGGSMYYFNIENMRADRECSVYYKPYPLSNGHLYADNFLEFLRKRLKFHRSTSKFQT